MRKTLRRSFVCFILFFVFSIRTEAQVKFIPNAGQWDGAFQYKADINGGAMFLRPDGMVYNFIDQKAIESLHKDPFKEKLDINAQAVRLAWIGGNKNLKWQPENQTPEYYNYYLSKNPARWKSGLHGSTRLKLAELYPKINLELEGGNDIVKYTYELKPGADPKLIKMLVLGASSKSLYHKDLIIKTKLGEIHEEKPYAYQYEGDRKIEVQCEFRLRGDTLSFIFPNGYQKNLPLTIDPKVIFATYSGSRSDNWGFTATYDTLGNAYGGGTVYGTLYPVDTGSYQVKFMGGKNDTFVIGDLARDVAIMKLNATGTKLLFATYLGGKGNEEPHSMVVDKSNRLIVFGTTFSKDFPVKSNAFDTSESGVCDIFISKFSENGKSLLASTFVGGSKADGLNGLAKAGATYVIPLAYNYGDQFRGEVITDNQSNIYVATATLSSDFPVSSTAYQKNNKGQQDACVFKMSSDLSKMSWSTYLGDTSNDAAYSVQLDSNNNAYVCGGTQSGYFFPVSGGYQTSFQGGVADGFVCKLKNDGSSVLNASYIGTSSYDQAYFVQLDKDENVYLYGQTRNSSFPVKNVNYYNAKSGQFIVKFDNSLQNLLFSGLFGSGRGEPDISPSAFLVDDCGKIYVSGWGGRVNIEYGSGGNTGGMPITADAFQKTTDSSDFYVAVFARGMDTLLYGSYFGGPVAEEHVDGGTSRFDKKGVIYQSVCGGCGGYSDFPTTSGAWSRQNKSWNCNNLVFKVDLETPDLKADFTMPSEACGPVKISPVNKSLRAKSYFWDFGDGSTDTIRNPTHTFVDSGNYKVSLIVKNLASCGVTDTMTLPLHIYTQANADFTIIKDSCKPTVSLSNKGPASTFKWDLGDGAISRLPALSHTYSKPGSYTISLLADSGKPCSAVYSRTIDVDFVKANFIMLNDSCNPTLKFINLSTGASSYSWTFSNGDSSTAENPKTKYTYGGPFYVRLAVSSHSGCRDTILKSFNLPELPFAGFSLTEEKCSHQIVLNNTSTGANTYHWDFGYNTSSTQVQPNHIYQKPGSYLVSLIINPGQKCADTAKKTVTLDFPTANYTFQTDTCMPIVLFHDSSGGAVKSYQWNFGNGATSQQKNPVYNYKGEGIFKVTLIITDSSGCIDSVTQTVAIKLSRSARFSYKVNPCDWSADFSNYSIGAYSYAWDFGDSGSSTAKSPRHFYSDSGEYSVRLIINPGTQCADTTVKTVVLHSKPVASFDYSIDTCTGEVLFLNKSIQSSRFRWDFDDSTFSDLKFPVHKFSKAGLHTIRLVVDSGATCSDTTFGQLDLAADLVQPFFIPNVFTPNGDGSNDLFEIRGISRCKIYELEIYNRWGMLIYKTRGARLTWDGHAQSNGKPMPEGTYFYVVKTSEKDIIRGAVSLVR